MRKFNTTDTEFPVCPYCNCECDPTGLKQGEIVDCPSCDAEYAVDARVIYTTRKVGDDA